MVCGLSEDVFYLFIVVSYLQIYTYKNYVNEMIFYTIDKLDEYLQITDQHIKLSSTLTNWLMNWLSNNLSIIYFSSLLFCQDGYQCTQVTCLSRIAENQSVIDSQM